MITPVAHKRLLYYCMNALDPLTINTRSCQGQ